MTWFEKIIPSRIKTERRTRSVPEGLWMKCPACDSVLYRPEVERNLQVCPKCAHHMRIGARERLTQFLDPESAVEIGADVAPEDPLRFRDSKRYRDRLAAAQKAVGERDALVVMSGTLEGIEIVAGAFEFSFMGGSMGSVVGERFVRGVEHAIAHRKPLVCFSASGGARMQEGLSVAPADGEDERGARGARGGGLAVHLGADRSDDGRRLGEPRHARRRQHRGTQGAHRLRGSARHPADRARDPARGIPAQRVPARPRRDRHDPRPPRPARTHRLDAADPAAPATAAG